MGLLTDIKTSEILRINKPGDAELLRTSVTSGQSQTSPQEEKFQDGVINHHSDNLLPVHAREHQCVSHLQMFYRS